MKKLLIIVFTALMMVGCNEKKEVPNKSKKMDEIYNAYTCEIDSCEYIVHGHGIAHKGNCKYCIERHKQEIRELINELNEK